MASFHLAGILETRVTVNISGVTAGDTVRVFVRRSDETTAVYDKAHTAPSKSFSVSVTGLEPETKYTANVAVNGTWIGAEEFETEPEEIEWPGDWGWWSEKIAGQPVKIRANEWMHFTERINEIRTYAGVGEFEFTYVEPGDPISATVCLEAYEAIYEIADPDDMPEVPFEGFPMKASFFNDLRDALNAVE